MRGENWHEVYWGGSPEQEQKHFQRLAKDILKVQAVQRKRAGTAGAKRAFHAKPILATHQAELRFVDNLLPRYQTGFARAGASYPATVRISNAAGMEQSDEERDLRGLALRFAASNGDQHDLLMTNFPVPHARDAQQFVAFALAMAGSRAVGIPRLVAAVGPREAVRMLRNVLSGSSRHVDSVARESYWSRGAMLWGSAGPVRYLVRPAPEASTNVGDYAGPAYLRNEIADRLLREDVTYELCVQPFVDERRTPIENAATEWREADSPPVVVAHLVLKKQNVFSIEAMDAACGIEEVRFNPWNTTHEFRPLGNLNRARRAVYEASAAHRSREQFYTELSPRNELMTKFMTPVFRLVNRRIPWYRLPSVSLELMQLSLFRQVLRKQNLIDTATYAAPTEVRQPDANEIPEEVRQYRTYDGSYNDLAVPQMGKVGTGFGRNIEPQYLAHLLDTPNPITVSRTLLYREKFIPATSLNILAAAWIQFQVHDWVQHGRYPLGARDISVALPPGERWQNQTGGPEEDVMRIARDRPMRETPAGDPASLVFANTTSHWWDASEVYGNTKEKALTLRDGAFLTLEDGYLPEDIDGREVTGFNESWWLGLSMMHTLFAREHNAVCSALKAEYKTWDDERVYQTARLIVSALIAKIHTIEWTPAILSTKAIDAGLHANWYGAPRDWLTRLGVWLTDVQAFKGIPRTTPDHHTAPYSLTEDFVTVYRLHPLLPDDYSIFDHTSGALRAEFEFNDIQGIATDGAMRAQGLENVLYSLGIAHPGAITLHNYPRALNKLERENGEIIDLSVVDIIRERHRGIPRYNAFREGLHKPRVRSFEEITQNPESVRRLKEVYANVDEVDTMVGLLAETPPTGFGFSDTAFRIFILMATRRLQSDRFLNVDYRPEVYSPLGIDWVENSTMKSVILRHCPELARYLPHSQTVFAPWKPVSSAA